MKAITYVTTVITRLEVTGNDVLLITLADPDRWELPPFEAGAHIVLYLEGGMRRAYSLCSNAHDRYSYQVAVKLETQGRGGSAWIHNHCKVGSLVHVSLPRSTLRLQHAMQKHILIAGGIGITPMLSLIFTLEREHREYELHYFYRGEAPLLREVKETIRSGRLNIYPADLAQTNRKELKEILPPYREDLCLYCCGPDRMMQAFSLLASEWQEHQLQQEHFAGVTVDDSMFPPYQIELKQSGKTLQVRGGQTPLEALLEADVYIDHSCEGGICGACSVTWCEGKPVHRDRVLTEDERKHKVILCVAGCESEKLVLDL